MDFGSMTAEQLVQELPPGLENDLWEVKSALLFNNTQDLRKELSVQTSAFSNTGGGVLVLGVNDKTGVLEPCPDVVGRQPMQDWLSREVSKSVDEPTNAFRVHRVSFANPADGVIFVVEYFDSPAAPHQAVHDCRYYRRVGASAEPANHFYVDMLSKRMTKSIVDVVRIRLVRADKGASAAHIDVTYTLEFILENRSTVAATAWGVNFSNFDDPRWSIRQSPSIGRLSIKGHGCLPGGSDTLLPGQQNRVRYEMSGRYNLPFEVIPYAGAIEFWKSIGFTCQGVSQNHIGADYVYRPSDTKDAHEAHYVPIEEALQTHLRYQHGDNS